MTIKNKILPLIAILLFMSFIPISFGSAASVKEVSMDEMLSVCQFVFEGQVVSIEAKENSNKRIHTYVTFAIHDIIKGKHVSKNIILSFLGGTVGDVTMLVSDMNFPEIGEHGIYFVESLKRSQVNPLYGWKQGHFLVETDTATGTERVLTRNKQPVTEVRSDKQMASTQVPAGLSTGVARGLIVGRKGESGMTLDQFKKALREQLGANQ